MMLMNFVDIINAEMSIKYLAVVKYDVNFSDFFYRSTTTQSGEDISGFW